MIRITVGLALALGAWNTRAHAQQSLESFVSAGEQYEPTLRALRHDEAAARSRVDEARATFLPRLTATAGYQRNETQVLVQRMAPDGTTQTSTILPYDQIDLSVLLDVPIVDVAAWTAFGASEIDVDGAVATVRADRMRVHVAVIEAWHRLVAARAIVDASEERLRVALEAETNVTRRHEVGVSPALDVARANVEVGLAREVIANARLEERLAARGLEAITGVTPDATRVTLDVPTDDAPALASYVAHLDELPALRAARERVRASARRRDASWQEMLPTLRGFARERFTNAAGFQPETLWSLGLQAVWSIDFGMPAALATRDHELSAAEARLEATRIAAETLLIEAWNRVDAGRARVEATEASLAASERAVTDAHERYENARATQLDVLLAERERFDARVARAVAVTQLAGARATLEALIAD